MLIGFELILDCSLIEHTVVKLLQHIPELAWCHGLQSLEFKTL